MHPDFEDPVYVAGYCCMVAGLACYGLARYIRRQKCCTKTTGTVTYVEEVYDEFFPNILRFMVVRVSFMAENVPMQTKKRLYPRFGRVEEGNEVTVMYDPLKPKRCYLEKCVK